MFTLIVVITLVGSNLFLGFFVASRLGFGPQNFTELFTGIYGRPFKISDELGSRIRGTLTAGQRKLFYDSVGENRAVPASNELGTDETKLECMLSTLRAVDTAERASVLLDEQRCCGLNLGTAPDLQDEPERSKESEGNSEESAEGQAKNEEEAVGSENGSEAGSETDAVSADDSEQDEPVTAYLSRNDAEDLEQWIKKWDSHLNELQQPAELEWWNDFLENWDDFLDAWNSYRESAQQLSEAEVSAEKVLQKANEIFEAKKAYEIQRLKEQQERELNSIQENDKEARRKKRKMLDNNPDRLLPPEYSAGPTLPPEVVDSLRSVRKQTIAKLQVLSDVVRKLRHDLDNNWLGKLEEGWLDQAAEDVRLDIDSGLSRFLFCPVPEEKEEGQELWAILVFFSNAQRIEFQIGSLASYSVSLGISQTLTELTKSQQMETPFYRMDKNLFAQLGFFATDEDGKNSLEARVELVRKTISSSTMFFGDMEIDPTVRVVAAKIETEEKIDPDKLAEEMKQAISRFTHDTKYIDLTLHPNSSWIANQKKISPVTQTSDDQQRNRIALFSLFHNG